MGAKIFAIATFLAILAFITFNTLTISNRIDEIKTTPEGINKRISEAEELISELEDKTVEITSEEQNKVKE